MTQPTAEQERARDLFLTGEPLVIEAGAGTGKTTTLEQLAAAAPRRRGQYMAFNTALVNEARGRMPRNCNVSTVHSLAFKAVGHQFKQRINGPRMRSNEIARRLSIIPLPLGRKTLAAGFLAGHAMRSLRAFCNSADPEPGPHVDFIHGIDEPDIAGRITGENNAAARVHIAEAMQRAWSDLSDPDGELPFSHDAYLKIWQRRGARIPCDYLLFDEGQDASGVMLAIATAQTQAQLVVVGDSCQAIYEWRGAVNALERAGISTRTFLTQSFRFGPPIADHANLILEQIGAPLRLRGTPSVDSRLAGIDRPAAILTRTNAAAVTHLLAGQAAGERPHLMGGAGEVLAFMRAARQLQDDGWTPYPDLTCFTSWMEVLEYVDQDALGGDLKLLVELAEEFGTDRILAGLGAMPDERDASVVISTAHKAKGREWPTVRLAHDFAPRRDEDGDERPRSPEELRLLYVACTRARHVLDAQDVEGTVGAHL